MENANDHPFKVSIVKDAKFFANSHPYKVTIEGGGGTEGKVVDELPEEGETGYIYLVLKEETEEGNIYDEYMWVLKQDETYGWERIGATNEVSIVLYDETGQNTDGAMTQKAVTDALDNVGGAKALTADDYNWNSTAQSATEPYDSIALWLLPSGQYQIDDSSMKVFTSITAAKLNNPNQHMYLINKEASANTTILVTPYSANAIHDKIILYVTAVADGRPSGGTTVNGMTIPWSGDIPTVVQTTGQSTTDVMSQKTVTDIIGDIETILQTLTTGTGV